VTETRVVPPRRRHADLFFHDAGDGLVPSRGRPRAIPSSRRLRGKAQLNTYAFSGLAFLMGTLGADTFMPPGKVAVYFGFQYMRDIDAVEGFRAPETDGI
jgi:hypothetical protein